MAKRSNTHWLRIRTKILNVKQGEMARIAGVSQGTVCKWEKGSLEPGLREMARIRAEVKRRQISWDDSWFFTLPSNAEGVAA